MLKCLVCCLMSFLILTGCKSTTEIVRNWNYIKVCAPPRNDSIQKLSDKNDDYIRVQLRNGDIGNCPSDNNKLHSIRYNKPYSERAELTGKYKDFSLNENYLIKFKVRFVKGFNKSDLSETFFQIKDCPNSNVPLMAKLGKVGQRYVFKFFLSHPPQIKRFITSNPIDNAWHDIKIYFYTGKPNRISIFYDDHELLNNRQFKNVLTCGKPTLRIGIYRSGNIRQPNSHSIVDYKNIEIKKIKVFPWDLKSKKGFIYKRENYFCFNESMDNPKVYIDKSICKKNHTSISAREYLKLKKIIEE